MGTGYIIRRGLATCESEPVVETGEFSVKFIDYDGTLLQEKRVDSGGYVSPPTAPTHDGLTFQAWSHATTNVTSNMNVGATYITTDGKTMLYLRVTVATGKNVVLYLSKGYGSTLTIDWGDSSANSTFTSDGYFNTSHTYSNYGDYKVKIWTSSSYYSFGNGTQTTTAVGGDTQTQKDMLLYAFIGERVTSIGTYAFYKCNSLTNITIPSNVTTLGDYAFYTCDNLTSITIPNSVASISYSAFNGCSSLKSITIPNSVTSIGDNAFYLCYSLTNIVIPNSVTSIGKGAFQQCYSLTSLVIPSSVIGIGDFAFNYCTSLTTYILQRTAGITTIGAAATFAGINASTKIYVPNALVSIYKSATYWVTHANYIYPISDKGVTHND